MKFHIHKRAYCMLLFTAILFLNTQQARAQWNWWIFMDVSYMTSPSDSAETELSNGGFTVGQFDLFTSYNVNDKLDVIAELVFEAPGAEVIVDLERMLIRYSFSDLLKIQAGRGHTPLGYYSSVFHHGRHLESAIGRPLILEFEDEGGLVPAHIVGAWIQGTLSGGAGAIDYELGALNGQKVDTERGELLLNLVGDNNKEKTIIGKLNIMPNVLEGLGFGASIYKGRMQSIESAGPQVDADQTILGAHLYYDELPAQFIGEFYSIQNKDRLSDMTYTHTGFFAQGAYEFNDLFRPYVRFESIEPEKGDVFTQVLIGDEKITKTSFGLRFNISPESSLKFEGATHKVGDTSIVIMGTQWAIVF